MSASKEKILVIVESPNKVKAISSILKNAGYSKAVVVASIGHIVALGDGGSAFNSGIYPNKKFQMNLKVTDDKQKIVNDIVAKATNADKIFVMTDGDREGEIIAWSIVKFCKLPIEKCFRAIAREITSKAIIAAIENPVTFNENLVNAGLARMMSDKLIGYGLSPLGKKYLGAKSIGRCQSVGLKLISEREREINEFIPELYFDLYLNFIKNDNSYKAKYIGYNTETLDHFKKQADVDAVINDCRNGQYIVNSIGSIQHKESPKLPFCTATFQQEAANKLGLRVKDAMSCAQKLFEGVNIDGEHTGLITYMRTDSTELASEFLPCLESFIKDTYGYNKYKGPRKTKKRASDQAGHEALRVVNPAMTPDRLKAYITNPLVLKVYTLIWQRTIAAVMPDAILAETRYIINNNGHKFIFSKKQVVSPGYRLVYNQEADLDVPIDLVVGYALENASLECVKKFTQPKARYTEASLVKELQQREIGRPSTYVSIVETILSPTRGYAKLEDKHIVPTDRGMQLADYCDRAFPTLINLDYTKHMEDSLDKIADGKILWLDYMENFYKHLQSVVKNTNETGIATDMPEKQCPKCGEVMIIRRSRFGKLFYGCPKYPKCTGIVGID